MTTPTKLYSYWRSSCSWRVRIALAVKKVPYDYQAVHLVNNGGEQFGASYSAVNAAHLVPSLQIDGLTLTQSTAICEYLEETRTGDGVAALLPAEAGERAHVRALAQTIASDTQPVQNLRVLLRVAADGGDKMAWGRHWITEGLKSFEALAASRAGLCSVGDTVTMADICLVPQVGFFGRYVRCVFVVGVCVVSRPLISIRARRCTMQTVSVLICLNFRPSRALWNISNRCPSLLPLIPTISPMLPNLLPNED